VIAKTTNIDRALFFVCTLSSNKTKSNISKNEATLLGIDDIPYIIMNGLRQANKEINRDIFVFLKTKFEKT
jgi:hypothetical protein